MSKISAAISGFWRDWRAVILVWLGWQVLLGALGAFIWQQASPIRPADPANLHGLAPVDDGLRGVLLGVWLRWDAVHYLNITNSGYQSLTDSAFFPLYPLAAKGLAFIFGGDSLLGLVISGRLACLFALAVIYKFSQSLLGQENAVNALLAVVLFPPSFFLLAPYPQSLAIGLSIMAIWMAIKGRWGIVALVGFLAGLTHSTTIPLVLALITQVMIQTRHKKTTRAWLSLIAAASPIIGMGSFLFWRYTQGFPPLAEVQYEIWRRVMQPPWMFFRDVYRLFTELSHFIGGWINLAFLIVFIGLIPVVWKKLPVVLSVYYLATLMFILSTTIQTDPFYGAGRYMTLLFPAFLVAGTAIKSKLVRLASVGFALFCQLFLTGIYFYWGWYS